MKKPVFFILFMITTIIGLSILQVVVSTSLSTTGIELGKYEEEIAQVRKENASLKEEVLAHSSYSYVASKAGELGFVREKNRIFLSTPLPLAAKP